MAALGASPSGSFPILFDLERPVARQINTLMKGSIPVVVDRDFVLARFDAKPLEHAVEVVHDTGVVAVHVNVGVVRQDLEANGRIG
jgi:hypothetical protein